jgi:hypothetical protein
MHQAELCWNPMWLTVVEVHEDTQSLWHLCQADIPSCHTLLGASGCQHSSMHAGTA